SQPSSPWLSRISLVAWISSGTVTYSQRVIVLMARAYRAGAAPVGPSAPDSLRHDPFLLRQAAQDLRPVAHIRMLAQQATPLPLGHAAPHTEVDAVVEGVGQALGLDRTRDAGGLDRLLI